MGRSYTDGRQALPGAGASATTHRIVLIEDNGAIRRLTSLLLREAGYHVRAAASGEDGVELVLRDPPKLVLVDLGLPGIDGCEVLARLRDSACAADLVVVAYTATVVPGWRDRLFALGFDAIIEKPIDPPRFARDIAAVFAKSFATTHGCL